GNYAACFGGDTFANATPSGPNPGMNGAFSVVTSGINKFPIGARLGLGKGTRITSITDGASNTLMLSQVLTFNQALDAAHTTHPPPAGSNRDWRGCILLPGPGGNTFLARTPPNSPIPDTFPGCDPRIPNGDPLKCVQNRADGNTWAAARSRHPGGVNAALVDG